MFARRMKGNCAARAIAAVSKHPRIVSFDSTKPFNSELFSSVGFSMYVEKFVKDPASAFVSFGHHLEEPV